MLMCMLKEPKIEFSNGRWGHLRNGSQVAITTFAKMIREDLGYWFERCPRPNCNRKLWVVEHDDNEYGVWCSECGWTAEEGFEFKRQYIPMPEVARIIGADHNALLALAKDGKLGAQNFGNGEIKAQWYLATQTVERLKREGLDKWLKRAELAPMRTGIKVNLAGTGARPAP